VGKTIVRKSYGGIVRETMSKIHTVARVVVYRYRSRGRRGGIGGRSEIYDVRCRPRIPNTSAGCRYRGRHGAVIGERIKKYVLRYSWMLVEP